MILAAGASSRLGHPKQLVEVGGERLLDRAVRVATEAGLAPLVVVLGAEAKRVSEVCDLRRVWVVVNARWAEGMGSSIREGVELVEGFAEVSGVVVMTCDMPGVTPEHLSALRAEPGETVASRYAGRCGVPGYFPRAVFPELRGLSGDTGARELLRSARAVKLADGGELDIDTAEDVKRLRAEWSK